MGTPRVQLGDACKDMITGFEGICVARTEWLNGCWRISIQGTSLDKDGKLPEAYAFDEPQIEIIESGRIKVMLDGRPVGNKDDGGPRDNVSRGAAAPSR